MIEMLSPGVYPVEVDFSAYVRALSTSTFGMVGVFEKGPIGEAVLVTSLEEARAVFGTYLDGHFGMLSLKSFFDNGGSRAYVVRTCHQDESGPTAVSANAMVLDRETEGAANSLRVVAATPGAWANDLTVTISASRAYPTTGFSLEVKGRNGALLEQFADLRIGAGAIGHEDHVERRINGISAYIVVEDMGSPSSDPRPALGSVVLSGGNDGLDGITEADFLNALNALDAVDVNFIAIPGEANEIVAAGLVNYAETRKDCIAIVETPQGLSAQGMADFRLGEGAYSHPAFNSSYGALYGPWLKAKHPVTNRDIVIPPAGVVAGIYARNDAEGAVWTAPAGVNRATVRGVVEPEIRLSKGHQDILYPAGVNAIAVVAGTLVVNGQKTLQLKASATDRVNVRRLLAYVEKAVSDAAQFIVFEPNNKATWEAFKRLVNPFLTRIKDGGGFYDYVTICDETLNTPAVIDQNIMKARILVKPTKTAEFINVEFAIAPTGADFSEL